MFCGKVAKYQLSSLVVLFFTVFLCAQTESLPNVILILSDDQGSLDANCYGAEDLTTPGIDRLAATGLRFTQFYVGAALCSPSRAALLTGRTPQGAGLPGNASSMEGVPGMPTEQITIAELLKTKGYKTAHIGKWHLGFTPETMPNQQGFDYSFGHMGGCIDNYSHFFYWNGPNRHDLWENGEMIYRDGQFFPDLMADKADAFIKENKSAPFFMYYAINVPHYPYQPKDKWRNHYAEMEMPRRDYAGFVSTMDANIDRLLNTLEAEGIRENTIVIFMSDHGHSVEERAFQGGGFAGPYRGSKMSLFEGGIRVPFVVSWPDQLEKGATRDQFCMSMDLLPTIAEWCQVENIPDQVEGKSMRMVMEHSEAAGRNHGVWKLGRQWAIRQGNWKLIGNPRDPTQKHPLDPEKDQLFLANLGGDITESQNYAEQYPDKVDELIEAYLAWPYASTDDIPKKLPPLDNKAVNANILLHSTPNPRYSAQGGATLIDNQRGTIDFTDGRWLGFLKADLDAEIRLKQTINIDHVTVRCMQDQGNYIFIPKVIEIQYSEDGTNYSSPILFTPDQNIMRQNGKIYDFQIPINDKARYLKVRAKNIVSNPDWHTAKGADSYLFIDEIIVY